MESIDNQQRNPLFQYIPLLLTIFLIGWTAFVYPFSQYGDRWAIYPAIAVFPLTIAVHLWLIAAERARRRALLYGLLHTLIQAVLWIGCLMLISKDSL